MQWRGAAWPGAQHPAAAGAALVDQLSQPRRRAGIGGRHDRAVAIGAVDGQSTGEQVGQEGRIVMICKAIAWLMVPFLSLSLPGCRAMTTAKA